MGQGLDHDKRELTFVAHHVGPLGGMERQATEILRGLLAAGWRVTVIAWACDLPSHERLRFIKVPGRGRPLSLGFGLFYVAAGVLARRHRRGVLHANGAIVPNRADVATLHFSHRGSRATSPMRRGSRATPWHRANAAVAQLQASAAERVAYRPTRLRALIGISNGASLEAARVYDFPADRIVSIPHGVDTVAFRPNPATRRSLRESLGTPESRRIALFVGGDWGRKGLGETVDALAEADAWTLWVVGAGDERSMATRAARAGVGARVRFFGRQADAARYFAAADAFVLPTSYETFCLVAHEAAASGLPLLVTRVHGVDELLKPGENGWFVTRDKGSISSGLRRLHERDVRMRLARHARETSLSYCWSDAVDAHIALYDSLLGERDVSGSRSAVRP